MKVIPLFTLFVLLAVPLCAVESEIGYDLWKLSFYSPFKIFRLFMSDLREGGTEFFEYQRSRRFDYWENTFLLGYTGKEKAWGWDVKAGLTPNADALYRRMAEGQFYLPSPGFNVEPILRGNYRFFTAAVVTTGEYGLRYSPYPGWDAIGRWGRVETNFRAAGMPRQSAPSTSYQLGYMINNVVRLYTFKVSGREFFDPGNPFNPGEFGTEERGGGFLWILDGGLRLQGSSSGETRTNDTFVRKYSISITQGY